MANDFKFRDDIAQLLDDLRSDDLDVRAEAEHYVRNISDTLLDAIGFAFARYHRVAPAALDLRDISFDKNRVAWADVFIGNRHIANGRGAPAVFVIKED